MKRKIDFRMKVLALTLFLCYTFYMKEEKNNRVENKSDYEKLIVSLVNTAVAQTEGIGTDVQSDKRKISTLKSNKTVHVDIEDEKVTVVVSVNVVFGYSVPLVVCELQEKIIQSVRENTPLKQITVNVDVNNAIFL